MEKSFWKPSNFERFKLEDQKFIDVILGKSNESVTNIVYRYQKSVNKLVWSFKDSKLNPEDIFQDGMLHLILNIKDGKFNHKSSVVTYLCGICHNKCQDRIRNISKKNKSQPVIDYEINEMLTRLETPEDLFILEKIIEVKNQMDKNCKELFDLRFNFDKHEITENSHSRKLKFDEIAEMLDLTYENAKKKFSRCLERLYGILKDVPEISEYYKNHGYRKVK